MIKFDCDYLEGAHPRILDVLVKTNFEQTAGYAVDHYCEEARVLIKKECNAENSDVHFIVGGTGTNTTVIAAALRPYQGVVCAVTGHINVHESGAIEGTGHKCIALPSDDGKVAGDIFEEYCKNYWADGTHDHMVQPKMLYISQPTENGTLYTAAELKKLREVCDEYSMYLYVDGARMGYGLMAEGNDVTLPLLAELCDVFYIGGTKVGALCGEAVIFKKNITPKYFMTIVKQHGAMLAKGRLLGIQFDTLFTDNLYFEISRNAIVQAEKVKSILKEKNYKFAWESPTNQQFIILDNEKMEELKEKVVFDFWEKLDESRTVVRFCTCWSTTDEDVDYLNKVL